MSARTVALVTGASRNIGRAIAVRLARDGSDVVVHVGRDKSAAEETVAEIRAVGRRVHVVSADLTAPPTCRALVEEAVAIFGGLDILVNNAAIRPEAPFEEITLAEWRRVMALALDAPFLVSQAAVAPLSQSGRAAIVHIGGLTGHTGAANRAHVVAAKAGLVGLGKAMAHDLADKGITVNCVVPGLIDTARKGGTSGAPAHHAHRANLLGRRGTAEDVAEAVAFFCSPANRYVTGQSLHVNGGAFLP
ncbi:short-chain dehydrogenase [Paramesorhizobium deserti]|uniref:Short-chain dehydrogenase n=1 Tax=Paramesorhizobium deserti TaxID=1494590 RepID=A0A135HNW1_9HYPH|nr:SDR family NAD(P)-dependent oxidoreductase [Paramesorhizobium deserti]KXF74889.1 short-chain dehydrogenase [Paramesorhizobium deserti]